jgi:hypothetical protein
LSVATHGHCASNNKSGKIFVVNHFFRPIYPPTKLHITFNATGKEKIGFYVRTFLSLSRGLGSASVSYLKCIRPTRSIPDFSLQIANHHDRGNDETNSIDFAVSLSLQQRGNPEPTNMNPPVDLAEELKKHIAERPWTAYTCTMPPGRSLAEVF